MIGLIGFEDAVVHQGMAFKWVTKKRHAPVHQETMKKPFENRSRNSSKREAGRHPNYEKIKRPHIEILTGSASAFFREAPWSFSVPHPTVPAPSDRKSTRLNS